MRRPRLPKMPRGFASTVYLLLIVVMGVMTTSLIVLLILGRGDPWSRLYTFLMVVIITAYAFMGGKARDDWRVIGKWDERQRITDSMREAQERGLSAEDWMVSYHERMTAEILNDG